MQLCAFCFCPAHTAQNPPGSSIPLRIKSKMLAAAPVAPVLWPLSPPPAPPPTTRPTGTAVLCLDLAKHDPPEGVHTFCSLFLAVARFSK